MRWESMYLAASSVHLPEAVPLAQEVAAGRYDAVESARTEMVAYTRARDGASSLEYAARAAKSALDATPAELAANLRALYHAFTGPPGGPPAWNPAAKLHELLGLESRVIPFGITNGCAIGLATVEEACLRLKGDPAQRPGAVLLVTSEVWPPELADPLTSARGFVLGDGAAAVVVSNISGFASILATASGIASRLADASRGSESLAYDPHARIDLGERFAYFTQQTMDHPTYRRLRDGLRMQVVDDVLNDAGIRLEDVSAFALTHSGTSNLRNGYFRMFPTVERSINTAEIGHSIGHVGTADWFIGLHLLRERGALKPGDLVLQTGGGGGWIEGAVLLRML